MGRTARRATAAAIIVAAAGGIAPTSARALDEDVMTNILSPIYLAKNLTAVCAKLDQSFIEDTRGRTGTAAEVTQRMVDQVLATMTRDEAAPIVVAAARHARAVGLGMIRAQSGGSVDDQTERVKRLCERTAEPFVRGVVEDHETRPDFFEQMLRDARQG